MRERARALLLRGERRRRLFGLGQCRRRHGRRGGGGIGGGGLRGDRLCVPHVIKGAAEGNVAAATGSAVPCAPPLRKTATDVASQTDVANAPHLGDNM